MQNKSKINIAVVLIAIGIGLIPTGLIVNEYIRDQVGENIPNTISHINEEAILEIEEQYLGLGIAEVLPLIQNQETGNIKDEIVELLFIPSSLIYLKNLSMPLFLDRLNASLTANIISDSLLTASIDILAKINGPLSAQIINDTLELVINNNLTTSIFAREQFFNNYTFQLDYDTSINGTSIKGISEYSGTEMLNFTPTAQQRLLDGYLSYPGLIQDVENGTRILDFMEFYENATNDPITYNITMQNAYNSTWNQLSSLADYISVYLWDSVIPLTWNKSITPSTYASERSVELFFNDEDWSTVTKNLTPIMGVSEQQTGGLNNLSYTTTAQQRILYGNGTAPGILENIFLGQGMADYLEYYAETSGNETIQAQYNATYYQLNNLTAYLIQYIQNTIVPAQLALEGLTLETAGLRDFYIQWANASIFTSGIRIDELSSEIGELLKARSAAYEIRDEIDSLLASINMTTARDLFFNNYTFQDNFSTSILGVSEFYFFVSGDNHSLNFTTFTQQRLLEGYGDAPGIFDSINSGFGLLNWLDFYESADLDIGTNRTLMQATYNATWLQLDYFGRYLEDYILSTIITASAQKGLEVGYPAVSTIRYDTTLNLWDPMNANGIVNDTGVEKWYKAAIGNLTIQNELNATFNMTQDQFSRLYSWLISRAKNTLTPIVFIIQQPLGIRLATGEYANILFLEQWANGTIIAGGVNIGNTVYHGSPDWFGYQNIGDKNAELINWIYTEVLIGDSYSEIIASFKDHYKVLKLHHDGTTTMLHPDGITTIGVNQFVHNYPNGDEVSGIREFWWATSDITESNEILFRYDTAELIKLRINDSLFQEYSGGAYNNITEAPIPKNNQFYHIKVDYNTLTDTYNLWIDGYQILLNKPFAATGTNIDNVMISLTNTNKTTFSMFLDAWGDPNDPDYNAWDNLKPGIKDFEVGIPIQTNISYNTAKALFDIDNSSSFIDNIGILKWIDAYNGDLTAKNDLILLFGLNSSQMDMTLTWLFESIRWDVMPYILFDLTKYTTLDLAEFEFHRQWTNGALFVNGIDLEPAFGLNSISGWELGIPVKSDIPYETSEKLWDEDNIYSIISHKGNGLWFMATKKQGAYNTLKSYFALEDIQMEAIMAWLKRMREEFSLPHLKEKLNLPTDVYTYGNIVNLGFNISGLIFLVLGCIDIILIFLSKRR